MLRMPWVESLSWPCRRATGHHFGDLPVAGRADVIARLDAAVGIEVPAGTDRDASSAIRQTQVAGREGLGGVRLKGGPIPGGDVAASGLGEVDAHLVVLEVLMVTSRTSRPHHSAAPHWEPRVRRAIRV